MAADWKMPTKLTNLAGVIRKSDLATNKKAGKFDYVAWAQERKLLIEHAPGWQYELTLAPDGTVVWPAPNGSGYLMGHFRHDEGTVTTDFPYAITDYKNAAISRDRISCADVANSHRRSMCACAAFTFCLAYEMWADEEILDTARENASAPAPTPPKPAPEPEPACPMPKPASASESPKPAKLSTKDTKAMLNAVSSIDDKTIQKQVVDEIRARLELPAGKIGDYLNQPHHAQVIWEVCKKHHALEKDGAALKHMATLHTIANA